MTMRRLTHLISTVILAVVCAATADAQTQTGTIDGIVRDQQGAILPGVTVTLTGPRGTQSSVSGAQGDYRFVGIEPATYSVKAELPGFLPQQIDSVVVALGKTSGVDFSLKVGGVTESVEVHGAGALVDVKSSSTNSSVSSDLLTLTPIYSSTSTGLLNYAPGINSSSAYGGQASYGNALLLDGVDTRDPEGGSAWTFFNQNLIQEVQIGGLGAPAEYGGFTGGIINTVTKSGSNAYAGLFSMRYTNDSLASNNVGAKILADNPTLGSAAVTKKLTDYTVQIGGPVKRDKAFFFASIQRYSALTDPSGPVSNSTDVSPRFNVKMTFQPTHTDTVIIGTQYDLYNQTGRVGFWPVEQATDRQTVNEDAPEWVWNAQWRKVFGGSVFLESKITGYTGYYNLDPIDASPYTYDADLDEYSGGGGGQYYADRSRNQAQVALTKYAEKFGHHSLKFGAEIERSHVRTQYQPYGPAGFYVLAYSGVPYYRVNYGYDVQGDNHRTSAYAQDQWTAGRLTMNLGVRLDRIRGYSPVLEDDVYTPHAAWGPRLGAALDITGKGTTVLRGFYGRYFEGTASAFYTQATPGKQDTVYTTINSDGSLGDSEVVTPASVYGIDPNIKHPRTDEFNVAWESQLTRSVRFTATGVWRKTSDFINNVITDARFRAVQLNNPLTNQPITGYFWTNPDDSSESFDIRNFKGYDYRGSDGSVIGTADPKRNYRGLILVLNSSMRERFGFQASYTLSKAEGSVDNTGFGNWLGNNVWNSPNTALINRFGELTNSRRHEIKAYMSYQVPRVGVLLGGAYTGLSGRPYTPYAQYSNSQLNLPLSSRRQIYLEPRGTEKNDFYNNFDLRAEKAFSLQGHRFGVYVDVSNLFNTGTVTSRQDRAPSTTIQGETVLYKAPIAVQLARQATIGGRWSF
ncbi:MAG: TonB-dependent receptor [Acidobacteriota bacterium]